MKTTTKNTSDRLSRIRSIAERGRAPASASPRPAPVKLGPTSDVGKWLEAQGIKINCRLNSFLVEVRPAIAQAWLSFNIGNRKPSQAKIRRFAQAMKTHNWVSNGETIKFSVSGRLIDGQSRLMAIIAADVAVTVEVRFGLPDIAQESMDTGELRKNSHTLEMLGENNAGVLAPALKLVWRWENGILAANKFGCSAVLENSAIKPLISKHEGLKGSVGWTVSDGNRIKRIMPLSEAAFFHYACGLGDREMRDSFFEALVDGVSLTKQAPVYHLRERLGADRASSKKMGKVERFALIIKAWNLTKAGEKVSSLRFVGTGPAAEKFPDLALPKGRAA